MVVYVNLENLEVKLLFDDIAKYGIVYNDTKP